LRKYNLFNFLEKKISDAEINAVAAQVAEEVAFRELALHIAVSYIANTMSKCEIKTYENGVPVKGKLYYLLNVSPNQNENSSQFINKFIEKYYYDGRALLVPHNDSIYCADSFDVDESNPLKEFTYHNVTFGTYQAKRKYKANEVFFMKLDNQDTRKLVDLLYTQYGKLIGLAMESFKRTNGKKYKLILEQYRAGDVTFNEVYENVLKKQLQTFVKNDNAVYPQFKGTDLQEFSTATPTPSDDIIALRKEIFETTAQAFKIPLSMMHGNITNMDEIVKVYLSICIDPLADMISEEFTRKYYSYNDWKKGNYIEVDTSCIKYVDILEVADKADKAIASGLCSIDELRPRIKLNPLDTEFSTSHFITKNYEVAENVLSVQKGGEGE
jgi:HK97 family phage portal protein